MDMVEGKFRTCLTSPLSVLTWVFPYTALSILRCPNACRTPNPERVGAFIPCSRDCSGTAVDLEAWWVRKSRSAENTTTTSRGYRVKMPHPSLLYIYPSPRAALSPGPCARALGPGPCLRHIYGGYWGGIGGYWGGIGGVFLKTV